LLTEEIFRQYISLRGRRVFLNRRSMDNLFLNRVIMPVEDAACGEADKSCGKDSLSGMIKFFLKELVDKGS